jgi:hypothetical protein
VVPPAPPLLTVRFDRPGLVYADAVTQAAQQALARKPDVQFDVVGVAPEPATLDLQTAALTQVDEDVRGVAEAIAKAGATPAQIHLSSRTDPAVKVPTVLVYVN